jgi:outer membrane lipase/esterase
MRRQLLASAVLACAVLSAAGAASAQTYDRLVVFGDSLSDNGNLFKITGGTNPASPPYFQGRFSNGPVFTELLGFTFDSQFGTGVAGDVNYAFGGARTDLAASPPGIRTQLGAYLAAGGKFGPSNLVSVYGGANNIFQGIGAAAVSPNPVAAITAVTNAAAADLGLVINGVASAGAGTVLVSNLPSLGATPQFNGFIPANGPAGPLAEAATGAFNGALLAQVNAASAANVGTNFIYMDVNSFDAWVRANPGAFGFSNITTPCLNLTTGVPCSNPDQFLYFDTVHPTAAGHRGLAALANDYLYYGRRGAVAAAIAETGLAHREAAQHAAMSLLEDGPDGPGARFSLVVDAGTSEDTERGDVPDVERDTRTVRFAVDAQVRPDVVVGLVVHGADTSVEAGPLRFDADTLGADLYAGFTFGGAFANVVVGGSTDEYGDYRRATGVGPISHTSDRFTGSSLGLKAQAGYRFALGDEITVSPRASLAAISSQVDAFSENGPAARHAVREQDLNAVLGEAAVRIETPLAANGRILAHIEGGYGEFLSYDGDVATALSDNPARPLVSQIDELGRGLVLDAGLHGQVVEGVYVGLSYRARYSDEHDSHQARVSISYRR